jgi:hypothetical protein
MVCPGRRRAAASYSGHSAASRRGWRCRPRLPLLLFLGIGQQPHHRMLRLHSRKGVPAGRVLTIRTSRDARGCSNLRWAAVTAVIAALPVHGGG